MLAWRQDIGAVRADISLLKGRIGEGFVEAILRRAGYFVARVGRETQMPRLMKSGTDTYLPDLLAWRQENKEVFRVLSDATAGDNLRGGN